MNLRDLLGHDDAEWMSNPDRNCVSPKHALPDEIRDSADDWFPSEESQIETRPIRAARDLCTDCPVINDCLTYALGDPDLRGIWGGTTTTDRAKLRGAYTKCGTYAGYLDHLKRDETACQRCSMANATASKQKRANAKAKEESAA